MPPRPRPLALFVAATLSIVLAIGACSTGDSAERDEGVSVNDITNADADTLREEFVGDEITVSGEIGEVLSPAAFTIGDDDLLVVGPTPVDPKEGLEVRITGTVEIFTAGLAESKGLSGDWVEQHVGDPALVSG